MRFIFIPFWFILCLGLSLPGCSLFKSKDTEKAEKVDEYRDWEAGRFYETARKEMLKGNYQKAIELYEALESRYPFGEYAAQTQLDLAYTYYKNEDTESALAAVDRFIKVNPRNPHIDYAYYLKGLVSYNRNLSFLNRFMPSDNTQRDPSSGKEAFKNFAELERRFPNSVYLADAKQRMLALRNTAAMHELHIARFYLKRKAYLAAANRAGYLVKEFEKTPAVPYALQVMQQAYTQLGLNDLANDAQRIYAQNYPDGPPIIEHADNTAMEKFWNFLGLDE